MAQRRRVSCINKSDRYNPHERIINVGGVENHLNWKMSQPDAIKGILAKTHSFYVQAGGYTTEVEVAYHQQHPYLRTVEDPTRVDNLLSLPECPP
ncbi:MAG TPA: DUF3892 domain-containing protein [Bacteroidota bacterium]|nr:DUF3892 domain-containing protein [Bacteroidota bacterium]